MQQNTFQEYSTVCVLLCESWKETICRRESLFALFIFYICGGPTLPAANIHICVYFSATGLGENRRKAKRPVDQDTDCLTRKEAAHGSKAGKGFITFQQSDVQPFLEGKLSAMVMVAWEENSLTAKLPSLPSFL